MMSNTTQTLPRPPKMGAHVPPWSGDQTLKLPIAHRQINLLIFEDKSESTLYIFRFARPMMEVSKQQSLNKLSLSLWNLDLFF